MSSIRNGMYKEGYMNVICRQREYDIVLNVPYE